MTVANLLNPDDYEDARQARDPRFDGRFFVGVLTHRDLLPASVSGAGAEERERAALPLRRRGRSSGFSSLSALPT